MNWCCRIGRVEAPLPRAVGDRRTGESLVEQHRTIGDGFVELLPGRMAMFLPLVRMPAPHRRDPLTVWYALAPRGQRILNIADRRRVLQNRVIAGPVRQAHAVNMWLDQPRHHR